MAAQWWTASGYPWNPGGTGAPSSANGQRNDYSIPLTVGTPITSPVSGIVLPTSHSGGLYSSYGQQPWGGEVDVLTSLPNYPGAVQVVDVLHFDTVNVKPGDIVTQGQTVLGTSGGQTSGGNWPSSPQFSQGPHIGVGVHAVSSWQQMYNPSMLINNLRAGSQVSSVPTAPQIQAAGLPPNLPIGPILGGLAGAAAALGLTGTVQNASTGVGWLDALKANLGKTWTWLTQPQRIGKVLLGGLLFSAAFGLFLISMFGPEFGAAAVTAAGAPEAAPAVKQALQRGGIGTRNVRAGIVGGGALYEQRSRREREFRQRQAERRAQRQHEKELEETRAQATAREYGRVIQETQRFFKESGRRGGQTAAERRRQRHAEREAQAPQGGQTTSQSEAEQEGGLRWFREHGGTLDDTLRGLRGEE